MDIPGERSRRLLPRRTRVRHDATKTPAGWQWGAPSTPDHIPRAHQPQPARRKEGRGSGQGSARHRPSRRAAVAGDSLGGTWWGLYSVTSGENDPGRWETRPSSAPRRRSPSSGAAGPPGTLRSLIKSRGGGERGGRPRGRGRWPPGMPRCRRRAPLRARTG